jgi:hypothetical protein
MDGEKEKNAPILTGMIEEIKELVNKHPVRGNKKTSLTCRVNYDLAYNHREGLEIEEWIKRGYFDIICLGVDADAEADAPVRPYVQMRGDGNCKICASMEGYFYYVGGSTNIGALKKTGPRELRAVAANAYAMGGDGLQLFNFCCTDEPWDRRVLNELSSEESLEFSDKNYVFFMPGTTKLAAASYWDSKLMLTRGEMEKEFRFFAADDTEKAKQYCNLPEIELKMTIMGLNRPCDIEVCLTGMPLGINHKHENAGKMESWADTLYYETPPPVLKRGENVLLIKRLRTNDHYSGEIEILEMELAVSYKQFNVIGAF